MKAIDIGAMNKKVYICEAKASQDAMGQDTIAHEKGKRIWATVRSVKQ